MENDVTKEKVRPVFITVLCVIAFLHVGMSVITGLTAIILSPELGWFKTNGFFAFFTDGLSSFLGLRWQIVMLIFSIVSFLGIVHIWKMKRSGVWLFSIPLFINIILPLLKLGIGWWILIPNILLIFFLIFLFALNYQKLK